MKNRVTFILTVAIILMFASQAFTQGTENQVPMMINYQGFLTDNDGTALTGSYQITGGISRD